MGAKRSIFSTYNKCVRDYKNGIFFRRYLQVYYYCCRKYIFWVFCQQVWCKKTYNIRIYCTYACALVLRICDKRLAVLLGRLHRELSFINRFIIRYFSFFIPHSALCIHSVTAQALHSAFSINIKRFRESALQTARSSRMAGAKRHRAAALCQH